MSFYDEEHGDLHTHVTVCAERYRNLNYRLSRLEKLVVLSSSTLFAAMMTIIVTLMQRL